MKKKLLKVALPLLILTACNAQKKKTIQVK